MKASSRNGLLDGISVSVRTASMKTPWTLRYWLIKRIQGRALRNEAKNTGIKGSNPPKVKMRKMASGWDVHSLIVMRSRNRKCR
ncbi:hypothetical protein SGB_03687 [Shigella boydii ATCC 9905]|nr:hypothetical protein SGB_03687 [Shigella boydii ATCC 9905]